MAHDYSVIPVFNGSKRIAYRVFKDGVGVARTKTLRQASMVAGYMIEEDEAK